MILLLKMKKEILSISISLIVFIISISGCIEEKPTVKSNIIYVDNGGGADYTQIQDAIDNADDGNIIYVQNGTYFETLVINKSISLIGASPDKTIIYFNGSNNDKNNIILINADKCAIKGFKMININVSLDLIGINVNSSNNIISNNSILNFKQGIYLKEDTSNNIISWNNISNDRYGIVLDYSYKNTLTKNNISFSSEYGIYLYFGSEANIISWNIISDNEYAISIKGTSNTIFGNTIINNQRGIYFCCGANSNVMSYNLFSQNSQYHAYDTLPNQWDSGSIGNYWDDFDEPSEGAYDNNSDGIIDSPYNILGDINQDRYPLMNPPFSFHAL